jgi:hypothetical protein
MSTVNIFAAAKKVEKTNVKKTDKEVLSIPLLEDKVMQFNNVKGQIDNLEAMKKMLEGDIKDIGRTEYCKAFEKTKVKPESFVIQDKTGAKVIFMATDKYTLVTEEKAEVMSQIAPELITTTTTYGFNAEVLERNIEAISAAILAAEMSDEDKASLIEATEVKSVCKGAIDRLGQYQSVANIFALINPICMLKPQKS